MEEVGRKCGESCAEKVGRKWKESKENVGRMCGEIREKVRRKRRQSGDKEGRTLRGNGKNVGRKCREPKDPPQDCQNALPETPKDPRERPGGIQNPPMRDPKSSQRPNHASVKKM